MRTHRNGWYFGNLVLGGVTGLFVVDPISGAMFSFPEHVHFDLATGVVTELSLSEADQASVGEAPRANHDLARQ